MKAFDILKCTASLSDDKACWSNRASLSLCWHSSLPSSLPIANLPSCQTILTPILGIWQHLRISLSASCGWFDRQLCQTHVLQGRLSFLLAALLSCLPSHHLSAVQLGTGQHLRKVGRVVLLWVVFTFHNFLNRGFSPLPGPLLRMLSFNTCSYCMGFPFSWDS